MSGAMQQVMMGKKRKSENNGLDEVQRTMYTTFCTAANSLSLLYSHAQHQQKIAFQAGEREALEKIYQWILRRQESGSMVAVAEIFSYLQNELDYGGDEASMSTGPQYPHQSPAPQLNQFSFFCSQTSSSEGAQAMTGLIPRLGHSDQNKNNVFSNALSSPVRRSLLPLHMAQGGHPEMDHEGMSRIAMDPNHGGFHGDRALASPQEAELVCINSFPCQTDAPFHMYSEEPQQSRNLDSFNGIDSNMEMHADGPACGYYQ